MTHPEIWRPVPSIPGLLASSRGRVMIAPVLVKQPKGGWRTRGGKARTGSWDGQRFILQWKQTSKSYKVARLVCDAFNGPPPFSEAVCMHRDENARNNTLSNLAWGTQKENLNAPGFLNYCCTRIGENSSTAKGRRKRAAS